MHFTKPITTLILATALAFGAAQGQESDDTTDNAGASADTARPDRSHDRPPRRQMSDEERAERRAKWDAMSDEEKQAAREKRREQRGNHPRGRDLSDEERAERRAKWEGMSEEERQAAREKRRQHHGGKDRPHPRHRPRPDGAPEGA